MSIFEPRDKHIQHSLFLKYQFVLMAFGHCPKTCSAHDAHLLNDPSIHFFLLFLVLPLRAAIDTKCDTDDPAEETDISTTYRLPTPCVEMLNIEEKNQVSLLVYYLFAHS